MIAVIDSRSPIESIDNLRKHVDDVFLFTTENITYKSISCHPDIFIYQLDNQLIIAPNAPHSFIKFLEKNNINFKYGNSCIGNKLQNSVNYNCVSTKKYFIHNLKFTDARILNINNNKIKIHVNQAYTACSLIALCDSIFITSDYGIYKSLEKNLLEVYYFLPVRIKIFVHKHGFLGGTCGIVENKIFFNGNFDLHNDSKKIRKVIEKNGYEIINLSNNYLYDGGKILFIPKNT